MSGRPDIELALDVRSYETVVVIAGQDSDYEYPDNWVKPESLNDIKREDLVPVFVIDRVEIQRKTLAHLAEMHPRMVAFAIASVDHEKQVRRMITALFPWNRVWTISSAFGKLLVTDDCRGPAYDREQIVDMRPPLAEV